MDWWWPTSREEMPSFGSHFAFGVISLQLINAIQLLDNHFNFLLVKVQTCLRFSYHNSTAPPCLILSRPHNLKVGFDCTIY